MNLTTATLSLIGIGGILSSFGLGGAQRSPVALSPKAQAALELANLATGHQWLYEYSWPNGKKHEFILHTSRRIDTPTGPVFELKNFSNTLKGQLIVSYEYLEARNTGVFPAENAGKNNTKPGYSVSNQGAALPVDLVPGATWRWTNGSTQAADTGYSSSRSASLFIGKVLSPKQIDTPIGKKTATVVQIFEKVQWLETTKRAYYVPGLGKVREDLLDAKGNLMQRLQMKKFIKDGSELKLPPTIDTGG